METAKRETRERNKSHKNQETNAVDRVLSYVVLSCNALTCDIVPLSVQEKRPGIVDYAMLADSCKRSGNRRKEVRTSREQGAGSS
jgi:hypothetical protein